MKKIIILSILISVHNLLISQCTSVVNVINYCPNQYAEFNINDANASNKYHWYGNSTGTSDLGYGTLVADGKSFSSPTTYTTGSGNVSFWVRKELYNQPAGASFTTWNGNIYNNGNPGSSQYQLTFNSELNFLLNEITIPTFSYYYDPNATFRVKVQVGITYSTWVYFKLADLKATTNGNVKLLTIKLAGINVAAGNSTIRVFSAADGSETAGTTPIEFAWANQTSLNSSSVYGTDIGSRVTINQHSTVVTNNSVNYIPAIFDWKIDVKCSLQQTTASQETDVTKCCTPVATTPAIATSSGSTVFVQGFSSTINTSNPTNTHYFKWYKNGVAIAGSEGYGLSSLPINDFGKYTVRVVQNQANIDKVSCYKQSSLIQIQKQILFAKASKTTNVCIGEEIALTADGATGKATWTPAATIQSPNQLVTKATPTQTTTYSITAEVPSGNLVDNWDFEDGNVGFDISNAMKYYNSSNITYPTVWDNGQNVVVPRLVFGDLGNQGNGVYTIYNQGLEQNGWWLAKTCKDHTTGTGNFYLIDAPSQNTLNTAGISNPLDAFIWKTNVVVDPNTTYDFSAWIANASVDNTAAMPNFQMYVNNQPVLGSYTLNPQTCLWQKVSGTWNSGSFSGSVELKMVETTHAGNGNDFMLDDIIFSSGSSMQTSSVVVNVVDCFKVDAKQISSCPGGDMTIQATTNGVFTGWTRLDGTTATITSPTSTTTDVTPTTTTTYVANARFQLGNLITNGNFENGWESATQFSDYTGPTNSIGSPGNFGVGKNSSTFNASFVSKTDHTSGSGTMLVVDGDANLTKAAFRTTVNVVAGREYALSAWIANIHVEFLKTNPDTVNQAKVPKVRFSIAGQEFETKILPMDTSWIQISKIYTASTTGSVEIEIVNANAANTGGNDFVVDDIVFAPLYTVSKQANVSVTPCTPPCNKPTSVTIGNGSTVNICDVTPAVALNLTATVAHGVNPVKTGMRYVWYKSGTPPAAGAYTALATNTTTVVPPRSFGDPSIADAGTWVLRVEDGTAGDNQCYTEAQVVLNIGATPLLTSSTQSICSGSSSTAIPLATTNGVTGTTYTWTKVASAATVTGGVAAQTTGTNANIAAAVHSNTGAASGTMTYAVTPIGPAPTSCVGLSVNHVITVNPLPGITGTLTACAGSTTTLSGSGTAAVSTPWVSATLAVATVTTGGVVTGVSAGTSVLTYTDNAGCKQTATVTITGTPVAPTVASLTYCQNVVAPVLSAIATGTGTLNWYGTSATGGTVGTAPTPSTSALGTISYYVSQSINGCEGPRAKIDVQVNGIPSAPVVAPIAYCRNIAAVALTATGTGLKWYGTAATLGTSSAIAPTPVTTTAGTQNNYVSQTVNGCESPRSNLIVTIHALPTVTATSDEADDALCSGENVVLTGGGAASYTWNNGVTNGTSFVPTATATYTATGTDVNGCISTATKTITVNPNPTGTMTSSQTLCTASLGSSTLAIGVSGGTAPYAVLYSSPSLATNNLTITGASGTITGLVAGNYALTQVRDNNGCSTVITNQIAVISVHPALVVTPGTATCAAGGGETATVLATVSGGVSPYSITAQSPTGGTSTAVLTAAGAFTATYDAAPALAYSYSFKDASGCAANVGTISGNLDCDCPVVATLSGSRNICAGNTALLTVAVSGRRGAGVSNYSVTIAESNNTNPQTKTLTGPGNITFDVAPAGTTSYKITEVKDEICTGNASGSATITVKVLPTWATNLSNAQADVCPGDALPMQVAASGNAGLTYQWKRNNSNIVGETTNDNSITAAVAGDAGTYTVDAIDTCGTITSQSKVVTVGVSTAIQTNLTPVAGLDLCPGAALNLNVVSVGTPLVGQTALTYTWTKVAPATTPTLGTNQNSYAVASVAAGDAGDYQVTVLGKCGTVKSVIVPVKVGANVAITTQPVGDALCPGDKLDLSVVATGTPSVGQTALSYVWTNATNAIVGATNSKQYSVASAVSTTAGTYTVVVSGKCQSATSTGAVVTVGTTTDITTAPTNVSICAKSGASFSVAAVGDNLSYVWRQILPSPGKVVGANATAYSIPVAVNGVGGAQPSDAGTYEVTATGTCGTDKATALLTITLTEFPKVDLSVDDDLICQGQDVVFTANATAGGSAPTYTFRNLTTNTNLQGPGAVATLPLSNVQNTTRVEVSMTSNSGCLDPLAVNPAMDTIAVTVVTAATADITAPSSNPLLTANATENLTLTTNKTDNSIAWVITQGSSATLPNPSTAATVALSNLQFDEVTCVEVTVQDKDKICPAVKDATCVERKNITQPILTGKALCEDQLPYTSVGNAFIPVIETPTIIHVKGVTPATQVGIKEALVPVQLALTKDTIHLIASYQVTNSVANKTLSDTALYTIYGKPTQANAGKDTTICSDINLYANTPTVGKGVWSCDKGTLDDATIPSARLTNLTKGDVATCTWTTSNGLCTSTSDGVRITKLEDVTPAQIFIDGKDVSGKTVDVCITGNNTLSANASAAFKTGESGVWTTASGTSVTGVVGSNTNLGNMTKATSGTTVINWEMSSPIASCPKSKAVTTIRVFAEPVANIASISTLDTCQNATPITLSTAAVSITDAGAWTSSLKPAATTANNWFLNGNTMAVGNNVITWEVTSPACPKAVDTETIRIEAMVTPSVSLVGQSTLCFGANPSYVASPTNGGSGATYVFDFDGDGNAATSSQASNSFSVNAIQASGKITVTMTSSLRCVNNRTATANVNQLAVPGPEPMVLTANDTICVTDPISIFGIDNAIVRNNTSYGWYRDGILAQKVVADANGNLTLSNAAVSGTYTIRADNGVCLPIESDSMVLDVRQVPSVNASVNGANPVKGFEGEALYLSGAHTGQSASWDGGVLLNPAIVDVLDMNSVLLTADRGGKYIATLTAVDGPCSASDAVAIQIQQRIKAPNVFTVNGDGVNETFHIIGIETWPFAKVTIFNRWGGKVYESSNYLAEEWNGGEAPAGVYYYVIDRGEDEKKGEGHSGVVHLIR